MTMKMSSYNKTHFEREREREKETHTERDLNVFLVNLDLITEKEPPRCTSYQCLLCFALPTCLYIYIVFLFLPPSVSLFTFNKQRTLVRCFRTYPFMDALCYYSNKQFLNPDLPDHTQYVAILQFCCCCPLTSKGKSNHTISHALSRQ